MRSILPWGWLVLCLARTCPGFVYRTDSFQVPVDHFSFSNSDTFQMRYLINDTYWNQHGGPIFFYTGNEGDIELFANNTGFMWEIAPNFDALLVFAEHRYYGHSMPYGNKSFTEPKYSGYLTSQQALADYVDLITYLRANQTASHKSPVIAFGGSYGGMLAAYIRIKYPHVVAGSIAASAPIWQFTGMTSCDAFARIVTSDFAAESNSCADVIRRSWATISNVTSTESGMSWLSSEWKLCQPLETPTDVQNLKDWLADVYTNLAMVNYPYKSNFLADLPAFPVREVCRKISNSSVTGEALLRSLHEAVSVYFNSTGDAKCLDDGQNATPSLGDAGWDYQSCTEMVMPQCTDGIADMFERAPWDVKKLSDYCWNKWKVQPQPDLAEKIYGGKRIEAASNIVFSNGLLDPWSSGGVLKSLNKYLISVIIPEGAHHLDLRTSDPSDPVSVREARKLYQRYIRNWINKS